MASFSILLPMQVIYTTFIYISFSLFLPLTHSNSIHELLISQGLPAGLFPKNVKSYDLDQDGHLQVHMDQPCMAKFETRVFFDSVVRANLSYGGLIGLEGLSQEELFLWLPVKDIIVYDPSSGLILFDIGVAHKQFSLSLFEDPPVCRPQGDLLEEVGRKEMVQVQREEDKPSF
ncbi:hypothetical protein CsSME_00032314 [Camellia sinensis var. sinensis]|uniref:Uncharacterized protein n=2 Tax=Camellia sinensis TaxID=4442 RepID=A0A7J7GVZ5_CAMSI|nr:uncharacterized protein LOC114266241 [Camellia sinensis]KAF5943696.1 hypothetical protein HYC85_017773 [Camellia sinensis]